MFVLLFTCLVYLSCTHSTNTTGIRMTSTREDKTLININITDSTLKTIIDKYIAAYPYNGKGIYIVNIKNFDDSVKYYIGIAFKNEDIKRILKDIPYYFYGIVNKRIVIIDTKLERFIEPQNVLSVSDTILHRYFDSGGPQNREEYLMEFTKIGKALKSKVVYFDPY